jgi:hypothetical protein
MTELKTSYDQVGEPVDQSINDECACLELAQAAHQGSLKEARRGRILELQAPFPESTIRSWRKKVIPITCFARAVELAFTHPKTW